MMNYLVAQPSLMLPHSSHATHATDAHGTAANWSFAQSARYEAGLGKITGVFEAEFVVQIHRLIANCFLGQVNIPSEQIVRP